MKNRFMIIAAVLTFSLLCGCGSVNVNIKTPAKDAQAEAAPSQDTASSDAQDLAKAQNEFPQLDSEDFDLSRTDGDNTKYFECHGNTWKLADGSADKFPKLAQTLDEIANNVKKYCQDTIDANDSDAKQFAEDNKGGDYAYYECDADIGPACADDKVVSLVETLFTSLGGAHPSTVTIPYNIDAQSGQLIPLSAVINDQKGLNGMLKEKLIELYTDHGFFGLDESLDKMGMLATDFTQVDDSKPQYVWSFNPNGLTFYFNPATLSPYSDGGEQVDLTYDELAPVLEDHFTNLYSGN